MKLGFAGLGLMGLPMASNLVRAGFPLSAYNRSRGARERLEQLGARTFGNPTEFFEACDTVILMLADDQATDEVLGRGTIEFSPRVRGKLIVNMGTHAPAWSKALEAELLAAGARFVEAPVSGSRSPAEAGKLVAMLAGDRRGIEELRPMLTHLCRETVTTGAVPSAMACKISVNLYLIASVAALAEATALARKLGLEMAVFAQVIGQGLLGSDVVRAKLPKMISRDFAAEASIWDVCKNAGLVADTAATAKIDAQVLGSARELFDSVLDSGGAKLDMAAVITAWDEEASSDD
jgi:3-hydroxyisobutyrate dehydrogenase